MFSEKKQLWQQENRSLQEEKDVGVRLPLRLCLSAPHIRQSQLCMCTQCINLIKALRDDAADWPHLNSTLPSCALKHKFLLRGAAPCKHFYFKGVCVQEDGNITTCASFPNCQSFCRFLFRIISRYLSCNKSMTKDMHTWIQYLDQTTNSALYFLHNTLT